MPAPRRPIVSAEPIRVGHREPLARGAARRALRVSYTLDNSHPVIGLQVGTYAITEDVFAQELAPARTYGFLRDVPVMRQNGLARGGSLENAVVVGKRVGAERQPPVPRRVRSPQDPRPGRGPVPPGPPAAGPGGRPQCRPRPEYQLVTAIQKAVAADRRRSVARVIRPAAPALSGGQHR